MVKKLLGYGSLAYFFIMLIVYPLYVKNGYAHIGTYKYYFFLYSSVAAVILLLPLLVTTFDGLISYTDLFVWGYLLVAILSFCGSEYKGNAWLGATGWYQGLCTQLLYVFVYFLAKGQGHKYIKGIPAILWMGMVGSAAVFVLGILNRFSVYPVEMGTVSTDYISTLGSINWYCGYWAVFTPIGIAVFAIAQSLGVQIAAGLFCYLAFLTGITQGSSSAFLVFIICSLVLIWRAFESKENLSKLGFLLIILGMSMWSIYWLWRLYPSGMQYESRIIRCFLYKPRGFYVLLAAVLLTAAVHFLVPSYEMNPLLAKLRAYLAAVAAACMFAILFLFVVNSWIPGGIWPVRNIGFFYFSDLWGNGRGGIWKDTLIAFRKMSLFRMLFGVGPDSYVCYVYEVPEAANRIVNQFGMARLTNAHNEYLNTLINMGLFGCIFYLGIFIEAIKHFSAKIKKNPLLLAPMLAVLGYMFNNLVSFPQVLGTPFVFLMLGLGEGLTKQIDSPNMISIRKSNEEE